MSRRPTRNDLRRAVAATGAVLLSAAEGGSGPTGGVSFVVARLAAGSLCLGRWRYTKRRAGWTSWSFDRDWPDAPTHLLAAVAKASATVKGAAVAALDARATDSGAAS